MNWNQIRTNTGLRQPVVVVVHSSFWIISRTDVHSPGDIHDMKILDTYFQGQ